MGALKLIVTAVTHPDVIHVKLLLKSIGVETCEEVIVVEGLRITKVVNIRILLGTI